MKKIVNSAVVEGLVSEFELEQRVSKKGVPFIRGKVVVVTDDAKLNAVTVNYNYVPNKYKSGSENKTYSVLQSLMASGKTIMNNPGEEPTKIKLQPSLELNEFYIDENGSDKLITQQRLGGGFAHIVSSLSDESMRNKFELDIVITNTIRMDGDEDLGTSDKLIVRGATFDYFGNMLPIELSVLNPQGMDYFEGLEAGPTSPVFTKVWGGVVNQTIVETTTEESAFGEAEVKEVRKYKRDWVITGTSKVPYEFDDEATITAKELEDAIAQRNITLQEILQQQKEYQAQKNAGAASGASGGAATPASGGFSF